MGLASLGSAYAASLAARPIITKSMTSAAIFGLSDVAAQKIGGSFDDAKRTLTSILVGLFYFGPALHYWLQIITAVIPGFGPKGGLLLP
jgi:protein Mpv17